MIVCQLYSFCVQYWPTHSHANINQNVASQCFGTTACDINQTHHVRACERLRSCGQNLGLPQPNGPTQTDRTIRLDAFLVQIWAANAAQTRHGKACPSPLDPPSSYLPRFVFCEPGGVVSVVCAAVIALARLPCAGAGKGGAPRVEDEAPAASFLK
jgi:hypothetical protein